MSASDRKHAQRRRMGRLATRGPHQLAEAIIADLRAEADGSNSRSITAAGPGGSPEARRVHRKRCEDLRRLANRYDGWLETHPVREPQLDVRAEDVTEEDATEEPFHSDDPAIQALVVANRERFAEAKRVLRESNAPMEEKFTTFMDTVVPGWRTEGKGGTRP